MEVGEVEFQRGEMQYDRLGRQQPPDNFSKMKNFMLDTNEGLCGWRRRSMRD
jgi:hypothetical protein